MNSQEAALNAVKHCILGGIIKYGIKVYLIFTPSSCPVFQLPLVVVVQMDVQGKKC